MRGPGAPPCPACGFSSHRRCAHASPGGCDTSRRQLSLAGRTCPMPCATRRARGRGRDTDARAVRPADQRAPGRWVGPTSRLLRHEHEQNLASLRSPSTCRAQPACEPPQTGCSESKAGCRRSIEGQRRRWGCQAHCRGAPWSMALASPIALRAPSMSLLEDARAEEDGRADEGGHGDGESGHLVWSKRDECGPDERAPE